MKNKKKKGDPRNETFVLLVILLLVAVILTTSILILQKAGGSRPAASDSTASAQATASASAPAAFSNADFSMKQAASGTYAPIAEDNATGFASGWSMQTTDGNVSNQATYLSNEITVLSPGANLGAISFYRDGIPFIRGTDYTVTFTAASSISRSITIMAENADDGKVYASQSLAITADAKQYQLAFSMSDDSIFNGRLAFQIGNDGSEAVQSQHTITISALRITPSVSQHGVSVNQIGYQVNDEKRCTFSYDAGDFFDVIDASTNQVVYTGAVVNRAFNENTGQTESYGDFTNLQTPGKYYVRSQIGVDSYQFSIGSLLYAGMMSSLLKTIALQRCGETLDASWAGQLAHAECHTAAATIYGTSTTIDVSGGWHDAGDYGRYVKTGTKTVNDLLLAYMVNSGAFSDSTGTISSGNGTSDLLDEARYELEWLLKMQDSSDGGVYAKVLTSNVADVVSPDKDAQPLYVLPKETTGTADFCGTMALASIAYRNTDPDFAATCLNAAETAYGYLSNHPDVEEHTNPSDINGGEYRDDSDSDGRFFSAIALWFSTQKSSYLDDAKALFSSDSKVADGVSWHDNGAYGKYLFLMYQDAESADQDFYSKLYDSLMNESQKLLDIVNSSGYNCSLGEYVWGSNGYAANNGILLSMAYQVTGDQKYRQAALEQVDYLLGRNSLDLCFVSGFGTYSPKNIHSRVAAANNTSVTGALVGGPDSAREDSATQALSASIPNARVYSDSYSSYSTNELSIYWNGALISLLAAVGS